MFGLTFFEFLVFIVLFYGAVWLLIRVIKSAWRK